ncbi:uncharacterized protein LOC117121198 [Anneissia japonica]|uniref:uncharacterized protein LOC117121198 n=1 Tax=Anneissia japonica TaxID=1529436 RepID=UPI001425894A|nr:uncharacterized protein LOC117121198 [Anneissia japonica]
MSKRKVDEAETTCGTWLTTRNKKQDLKEFESNMQRLSQRRFKLLRLSKRPVGMVTAVKQSKLSDFFPNFNSGKENSCTHHYHNTTEKPQQIKGQTATIDGMWTNVKFEEASSQKHIPLSAVNYPSSPVNRGCYHVSADDASTLQCKTDRYDLNIMNQHSVLNYDKCSSNRTIEASRARVTKHSKIQTNEGSSHVIDNKSSRQASNDSIDIFELSSYNSRDETNASYIISDNFHRNSSNQKIHEIDNSENFDIHSVQTPENENVLMKSNVDVVTALILQNTRHQSILERGFKNVSTENEKSSEILPNGSQSQTWSENFGMIHQSEPSSETLLSEDYSFRSLRFTLDSEEQILKLQESCIDSENLKDKLHEFDSEEPILKLPESCLESEDLKLQETCVETERPNIKLQESLLDSEELMSNLQDSGWNNNHILQKKHTSRQKKDKPHFGDFYQLDFTQEKGEYGNMNKKSPNSQHNTTIDSLNEIDHNFSLLNSLELVEDSQGCLQVKGS